MFLIRVWVAYRFLVNFSLYFHTKTLSISQTTHLRHDGALTAADILDRSEKLTNWLIKQSSKLIVVACNTATTNAIDALRQTHPIPFVGIEPAIKPAALQTKTGVVGVLATKGTFLSSKLFHQTSNRSMDKALPSSKKKENILLK